MNELKKVVDSYMQKVPEVKDYCTRCLKTERWGGSAVLMIVDAAFTSIGLNYFQTVVPRVGEFEKLFLKTGKVTCLGDLVFANIKELRGVWKNRRSWEVAKSVASYLAYLKKEIELKTDAEALIYWAKNADVKKWKEDAIGKVSGVGINTFQYLRMMGGVDTVMPDKVVKRVIKEILEQAKAKMSTSDDSTFIETVHKIAERTGYRPIELCWMTWLVQSEAGVDRSVKYAEVLPRI